VASSDRKPVPDLQAIFAEAILKAERGSDEKGEGVYDLNPLRSRVRSLIPTICLTTLKKRRTSTLDAEGAVGKLSTWDSHSPDNREIMGHIRLGTLPRTRKWIQVLDLIGAGAGTQEVAAATMEASQRGLVKAAKDHGLVHTVWLLTQILLAARGENFVAGLRRLGLEVSNSPSLLEVVGAFTGAVHAHLRRSGGRTDLGEMAQMAAAETLTALGTPRTASLFGTTSADVQQAFKSLSTTKQFGTLAREFFTRLSKKYLTYFLSRELSNYVSGHGRFTNIDKHAEFNEARDLHCRQASRVIEEFSGGWFSKTNYEDGISPEKAAAFIHVALKPVLFDLLEIATYVYCADQATTRGGGTAKNYGAKWRRRFQFHIPVRTPDVWSSNPVLTALSDTLGFLSDDEYEFAFKQLSDPPPVSQYLDFGAGEATGFKPEEVILFSGGLDSLGGAVQQAAADKRTLALVSHRSSPKIGKQQKELLEDLAKHCSKKPFHVPVWIYKEKALGKEFTQRTRSFLYASLAAVVARIFDLWRIRFYENGVVSINLPISPQVVGGRATRTTHPQVLNGFSEIFTALFQKPFAVENPFLWMTKGKLCGPSAARAVATSSSTR
jgi:hypothetical protein